MFRHSRRGFTLVELLVVIAIIGVLVGLLLPAVQAAREAARRMQCSNNLKQMGLGMHNYHDSYNTFPPGSFGVGNGLPWNVAILPYMEQSPLYERFNMNLVGFAANNAAAANPFEGYFCPSGTVLESQLTSEAYNGKVLATTHYLGVAGPKGPKAVTGSDYQYDPNPSGHGGYAKQGMLGLWEKIGQLGFRDVTDGTSNTLLIGELSWTEANAYRAWHRGSRGGVYADNGGFKNVTYAINAYPYNGVDNWHEVSFGSNHPGGALFLNCDGSVGFLSENMDMVLYKATASRNGSEITNE